MIASFWVACFRCFGILVQFSVLMTYCHSTHKFNSVQQRIKKAWPVVSKESFTGLCQLSASRDPFACFQSICSSVCMWLSSPRFRPALCVRHFSIFPAGSLYHVATCLKTFTFLPFVNSHFAPLYQLDLSPATPPQVHLLQLSSFICPFLLRLFFLVSFFSGKFFPFFVSIHFRCANVWALFSRGARRTFWVNISFFFWCVRVYVFVHCFIVVSCCCCCCCCYYVCVLTLHVTQLLTCPFFWKRFRAGPLFY